MFYNMEESTEQVLAELLAICQACRGHGDNPDAYTSPGFSEFLNRALTIADIPMQSYNIEKTSRRDPDSVPWEDSIKNFIFDMTSFNTTKKFDVCILLAEFGYKYTDATLDLLTTRHCKPTSSMISVEVTNTDVSDSDSTEFKFTIIREGVIEYTCYVTSKYLVSTLVSWYVPGSTMILCHDSMVNEYTDCISMMPRSDWSVSCTTSNFIECDDPGKQCKHICPTYSCLGSLETRAVGSGNIKVTSHKMPRVHEGKLNYYLRCVRGSKHSSGRCYDCQSLYKVITSIYKTPECSPVKASELKFSPTFLTASNSIFIQN